MTATKMLELDELRALTGPEIFFAFEVAGTRYDPPLRRLEEAVDRLVAGGADRRSLYEMLRAAEEDAWTKAEYWHRLGLIAGARVQHAVDHNWPPDQALTSADALLAIIDVHAAALRDARVTA